MPDKELLDAIGAMMDSKLEPINARLDSLENGQQALQAEQKTLQAEQKAMQAEQKAMQSEMRKGFKKVHGDIGHLFENSDKNMKLIVEGLGHLNERYAQLDKVEKQTDDHDNRIFALEHKVGNG